jgi:hypothetical protein
LSATWISRAGKARTCCVWPSQQPFRDRVEEPLDDAILAHEDIDVSAWKKIDEVPFDFERRRVSVLLS